MVRCSMNMCKSDSERKIPGMSFHSFPSNNDFKKQWVEATGRTNWEPTKNARICSMHFDKETIIKKNRTTFLMPGAVPQPVINVIDSGPTTSSHYEVPMVIEDKPMEILPDCSSNTDTQVQIKLESSLPLNVPRAMKRKLQRALQQSNNRLKTLRALREKCRRLSIKVFRLEDVIAELKGAEYKSDNKPARRTSSTSTDSEAAECSAAASQCCCCLGENGTRSLWLQYDDAVYGHLLYECTGIDYSAERELRICSGCARRLRAAARFRRMVIRAHGMRAGEVGDAVPNIQTTEFVNVADEMVTIVKTELPAEQDLLADVEDFEPSSGKRRKMNYPSSSTKRLGTNPKIVPPLLEHSYANIAYGTKKGVKEKTKVSVKQEPVSEDEEQGCLSIGKILPDTDLATRENELLTERPHKRTSKKHCPKCTAQFSTYYSLQKHLKDAHSESHAVSNCNVCNICR